MSSNVRMKSGKDPVMDPNMYGNMKYLRRHYMCICGYIRDDNGGFEADMSQARPGVRKQTDTGDDVGVDVRSA